MPPLPRPYPYYRKDSHTVYATAKTQDGRVLAILHATLVVETKAHDGNPLGKITLDHGGHRTPTTIRAINRTASAWGLGFEVHAVAGEYKVHMAFEGHSWSIPWSGQTVTFSHPSYGPNPTIDDRSEAQKRVDFIVHGKMY